MAKWDPGKTFATAQRIFGGACAPSVVFIMFLAEVRFAGSLAASVLVAGCQIAHARDKRFYQ